MLMTSNPGWLISSVDQSVQAERERTGDRRRHSDISGIRIQAMASGARYATWLAAVRANNEAEVERITIWANGYGDTYVNALHDLETRIRQIEATNPL